MASQTIPPEDDPASPGDSDLPPELVSVHDPGIDRPDDAIGRRLALLVGGFLPAQITTTFAQLAIAEELGETGRTASELAQALDLPARRRFLCDLGPHLGEKYQSTQRELRSQRRVDHSQDPLDFSALGSRL